MPMPFGSHNVVLEVVEHLQVDAELVLELAERARQRRLREVQPLGGPRHVALLGDGEEGAQVTGLDGHTRGA